MRDQLGVLLAPLAEAEPGIEHQPLLVDTGAASTADRRFEILPDAADQILDRTHLRPRLRSPAHVSEHVAHVELRDRLRHVRIPGKSAWIVDDLGAVLAGL